MNPNRKTSATPLAEDNAAKTFVVTGVTSGIGLSLARALVHTAGRLVIVGRNEARLQAAAEAMANEARNLELIPMTRELAIQLPVDMAKAVVQKTLEALQQRQFPT